MNLTEKLREDCYTIDITPKKIYDRKRNNKSYNVSVTTRLCYAFLTYGMILFFLFGYMFTVITLIQKKNYFLCFFIGHKWYYK